MGLGRIICMGPYGAKMDVKELIDSMKTFRGCLSVPINGGLIELKVKIALITDYLPFRHPKWSFIKVRLFNLEM